MCSNLQTTLGNLTKDFPNLIFYDENNITFCFEDGEINDLIDIQHNPYTGKKLSNNFISYLDNRNKLRKLPLSKRGHQCLSSCRKSKVYPGKWVCKTKPHKRMKFGGKEFNWDWCRPSVSFQEPSLHLSRSKVQDEQYKSQEKKRGLMKSYEQLDFPSGGWSEKDVNRYKKDVMFSILSPKEAYEKAKKLEDELAFS